MSIRTALALALAPAVPAQTVHVVAQDGTGDFATVQAAVDAAVDGDTIVVRRKITAPPYGGVTIIGKSLTIVGTGDGRDRIAECTVRGLAPGGRVELVHVTVGRFDVDPVFLVDTATTLEDCDGTVVLDRCRIGEGTGVHATRCAHVHVVRSTLLGRNDGAAIDVVDSNVVVERSSILGSPGYWGDSGISCTDGGPGGFGARLAGSSLLWASGSHFEGGRGGPGGSAPGSGCVQGPDRPALEIGSGSRAFLRATTVEERVPSTGTIVQSTSGLRRLECSGIARSRAPFDLLVEGEPGDTVFLLVSGGMEPEFRGDETGWYQSSSAVPGGRRLLGVVPASGSLPFHVLTPHTVSDAVETFVLQTVHSSPTDGVLFAPARLVRVVGDDVALVPPGATVHVDADAPAGGDGRSWATALRDLRDALERLVVDEHTATSVWVAEGVHRPAPPGGDRSRPFRLPAGVNLLGGFAGDEVSADEADPWTHRTVLSGDLDGDDDGTLASRSDNSVELVQSTDTSGRETTIDGFELSAVNGIDGTRRPCARIYGRATIRRCVFAGNVGDGDRFLPDITGGRRRVESCVFRGNVGFRLSSVGGDGEEGTIDNCLFIGNASFDHLVTCAARPNSIRGCTMAFNRLAPGFAAVALNSPSSSTGPDRIENTIVWGNHENGVAMPHNQVRSLSANPAWDRIDYSCIQFGPGAIPGDGTIALDPRFRDAAGPDGLFGTADDDLRLGPGSPCVDAGDNERIPDGLVTDLDGTARRKDDPNVPDTGNGVAPIVDMGAYER